MRELVASCIVALSAPAWAQEPGPDAAERARFPAEDPTREDRAPSDVTVAVDGKGRVDAPGQPTIRVDATSDPAYTGGRFRFDYADGSWFDGPITCVVAWPDLAYVVGRVEAEAGDDGYDLGDYVWLGVRDGWASPGDDAVIFSPGLEAQPACDATGLAAPHVPLLDGNFNVQSVERPRPVS